MHTRQGTWIGSRRDVLGGTARLAAGGALAAVLARHGAGHALAQATPGGMAYPELKVTITDQALQVSAKQIPAGYVLLTVVNQSKNGDSAGLLGPGPGQTMAQLQQAAAACWSSPEGIPSFILSATVLGGPGTVAPGGTGQAVLQVPAGQWVVIDQGNLPPTFVTATGSPPAGQAPPTAAVTITEVDFAFGGFGVQIPAGKQTWQVVNQGTQPHMLVLGQVPAGTTVAQVLEAASRPPNTTPPPGGLAQSALRPVSPGGVILQSKGTTVWPLLDLPAGRYTALCFVPDPMHGGVPHAMEGMVAVFDTK